MQVRALPPQKPRVEHASEASGPVVVRLWAHDGERHLAPAGAHSTVELAWVDEGQITYRIGSKETVVVAGQAMMVPRGVEHATSFDGPLRAGSMALSAELVAEVEDTLGVRSRALDAGLLASSGVIVTLGRVVRAELVGKEVGHLLALDSLAETMTIAMLRGAGRCPRVSSGGSGDCPRVSSGGSGDCPRVSSGGSGDCPRVRFGPSQGDGGRRSTVRDPRVRAVLDLIRTSYADPISIEEMARAAGMSRFHLSRVFRDAVGQSPYQHLVRTRIENAAELLASGRRSVTEVAFAVGFGDLGRFAREFRSFKGETPGAFAKRRRGLGR